MNTDDAIQFDEFIERNWGKKVKKVAKKWGEN
jgi:hypothetical protein